MWLTRFRCLQEYLQRFQDTCKGCLKHHRSTLLPYLLLGLVLSLALQSPAIPITSPSPPVSLSLSLPTSPFDQGTQFYHAGQFFQAAAAFLKAAESYRTQAVPLRQAAALSNLSLSYQQLGLWTQAQQAIAESLRLSSPNQVQNRGQQQDSDRKSRHSVWAQALEIQAGLYLAKGQPDRALALWQQVEQYYAQHQDAAGLLRARLNQAKAYQIQGFYRRALTMLEQLEQQVEAQPDSITKAIALRSLGDTLHLTGDLAQAQRVLKVSLEMSRRLKSPELISAAQLSLGNTARTQKDWQTAIDFYAQAATTATTPLTSVQAQINHFGLLNSPQQRLAAIDLFNQIQAQLSQLPLSRASAYAHINLAQALMIHLRAWNLNQSDSLLLTSLQKSIATLLNTAIEQCISLNDESTKAYALGISGHFHEQQQQWTQAQQLTEQALLIAQAIQSPESLYRWHWQLGRIARAKGDLSVAKTAYQSAITTLQSLRTNLAAINRDVQFDFRDSVEPVYREAVELLLTTQKTQPSEQNLEQARTFIDQLQLAELDNFFQEACLDGQSIVLDNLVDRENPTTAIVYPIILEQELQVIVKIPQQPLRNYGIVQPRTTTELTLKQLRQRLVEPTGEKATQRLSQRVYQWLIQPIEADLAQSHVNTLVFVLDGEFRNLPMAALYDGQQYLVEKYAVAVNVGLQLLQPHALNPEKPLTAIAAGLTVPPPDFRGQGYAPLPEIKTELSLMQQAGVQTQVLLDEAFQRKALAQTVQSRPTQIVHLATHGNFSSRADQTYILASDGAIYVNDFDTLLRYRDRATSEPIELLTLSACQTAAGDARATLGLAGVAIRAGARSTLASLWQVDDRATALLMGEFYRQLTTAKVSKAESLRRAQLSLLKQSLSQESPAYRLPLFWSAYVLVGNWL